MSEHDTIKIRKDNWNTMSTTYSIFISFLIFALFSKLVYVYMFLPFVHKMGRRWYHLDRTKFALERKVVVVTNVGAGSFKTYMCSRIAELMNVTPEIISTSSCKYEKEWQRRAHFEYCNEIQKRTDDGLTSMGAYILEGVFTHPDDFGIDEKVFYSNCDIRDYAYDADQTVWIYIPRWLAILLTLWRSLEHVIGVEKQGSTKEGVWRMVCKIWTTHQKRAKQFGRIFANTWRIRHTRFVDHLF